MEKWSTPDNKGIRTLEKNLGVSTLKGRRYRKADQCIQDAIKLWPGPLVSLLKDWVQGSNNQIKWNTLVTTAGNSRYQDAVDLLEILLVSGFVQVEEDLVRGVWRPIRVMFLNFEDLRELLGLPNRDKQKDKLASLANDFSMESLLLAAAQLVSMPAASRIKRHELLVSLDQWQQEGRMGTRRDFSLYVRGRTKEITSAEWSWLETNLDLESLGITTHTPLLRIKFPGGLQFPEGTVDLTLFPGSLGLTKEQIMRATGFKGNIARWKIIENLTSFEKVVKESGPDEAVAWVPGFAPTWWKDAMGHLARLTQSKALVACDPDPAGLFIASQVGEVWEHAGGSWSPWMMSFGNFENAPPLPLTQHDQSLLQAFRQRGACHSVLDELASWMEKNQKKFEQESFV